MNNSFVRLCCVILTVLAALRVEAAAVVEIKARFEADEDKGELVGNNVAELDGVKIVSNGAWNGENLAVQVGQTLTVEAQEFENIYMVVITALFDDLTAKRTCRVTYAKGTGVEGIESLGESASAVGSLTTIGYSDALKWTFEFPAGIELSDVSFEFATDVYVNSVVACLDVLPKLPEGETNLVGDDKLLISKRSNAVDYIYTMTNDTDEILSSPSDFDDYEEVFKPLPEDGVSLTGHPEGKYALYVAAVPNSNNVSVASNTNHVIVNYSTKSPSTSIDEVAVSKAEYYDLQGRRVVNPTNGLCIVRNGTASRVQLIK